MRFRSPRLPTTAVLAGILASGMPSAGCGRPIGEESDSTASHAGSTASSTTTLAHTTTTPTAVVPPARAASGEGWNAGQIAWQSYDAALAQAKAANKPVMLVFSTTWCPHCKNYSHVFEDPRVVASARDFEMVHLDADAEETIASKYAIDGTYIPRTFFLSPDGKVDDSIHADRPRSKFFYDENNPGPILAAMDTAKKRLVN